MDVGKGVDFPKLGVFCALGEEEEPRHSGPIRMLGAPEIHKARTDPPICVYQTRLFQVGG